VDSRDYFNRKELETRPRPASCAISSAARAGVGPSSITGPSSSDYEVSPGEGDSDFRIWLSTPNARLGILQDPKDATKNQAALVGACARPANWTQSIGRIGRGRALQHNSDQPRSRHSGGLHDDSAFDMLRMFQLPNPGTYNPLVGTKGNFISSAPTIGAVKLLHQTKTSTNKNTHSTQPAEFDHKSGTEHNLFGPYLFDDTDYTQPDAMSNYPHQCRTRHN